MTGVSNQEQGYSAECNESNRPIVLIGTYRIPNAEWIDTCRLYNLPISSKTARLDFAKFTHVLLFADDCEPKAYSVRYTGDQTIAWLRERGYKTSKRPHGERYAIFDLTNKVNPDFLFLSDMAEAWVCTSHWAGVVSPSFYTKLLPECEGDSTANLFARMKPYIVLPKSKGIEFKQMEFWKIGDNVETTKVPFPGPKKPKFTFIDLFAGIGGFRLAMQACGGQCVYSSEFDPPAQKTYAANFGDVPYGDITKKETKDAIPGEFDIVCAGFPCQAFSLAGKRMGFNDNYKGLCRGTLFKEVVEICENHKPKAVFCENVKGLLIHDRGRTLQVIKGAFEEIGYKFFYQVLNSKDFGVPQHRERVYMVAFRNDIVEKLSGGNGDWSFPFPKPTGITVSLQDIRETNVPARYYLSDVYMETLRRHRARHEAKGHGFGFEIRDWKGIAGAIVCGGMGRERNLVIDKTKRKLVPETHIKGKINEEGIRKMTPREWARLQGFPENYKFVLSDVHLYKQFGNSVSVPVIEAISRQIIGQLKLATKRQ